MAAAIAPVLLYLLFALPASVSAQEVDLVLPPRSQSANVTAFAFGDQNRVFLGRQNAFCDLDLGNRELRCNMTRGVVASLVATDAGGSAVVVFADTITQAGECKIELHAYHPKSRRAQLLTQLTLPCQLGREVRVLASRVVRATYITVITESALRVFALRKGPQGYDAVPTWTYASTPRAEGGLAGPIAVAASNRAVYVLAEWWSDFSDGEIRVLRHEFVRDETQQVTLPVPPEARGVLGPTDLLVSADDSALVLMGQVGADPGQFVTYDLANRSPRCHFTNRSLRALDPSDDVLLLSGGTLLSASVEGAVVELDLCGRVRGRSRVDYLPAQIPIDLHGLEASTDGRRLYALLSDGVISVLDRMEDKVLASLFLLEKGEWVALLPEGYYSSSRNGHDYLGILLDDKLIGLNQFYDAFYRPDLVDRRFAGERVEDLMTATLEEAMRQPPPRVDIVAAPENGAASPVEVRYRVESTGGGIGEVRVFHNGKLVWSDAALAEPPGLSAQPRSIRSNTGKAITEELRGLVLQASRPARIPGGSSRPIAHSSLKSDVFDGTVSVTPVMGVNEVTVVAFNAANTVQSQMQSVSFKSSVPPRPPDLYIVAVGIDHYLDPSATLKFAAKDARDAARRLSLQGRTRYPKERIHTLVLTDKEASRTEVLAHLEHLISEVGPEDQFILFVASHGVLLGGQYFMLTHEYDGTVRRENLIGSGELVDISRRIAALSQLVVLDTCHAGGMDEVVAGLYDARISVLARQMGLHIYASAGSLEAALDGYRGNGLFTHAVLAGLADNRDADLDRNNEVSVVELGRFADALTRTISAEIGHRQRPVIIEFGRDNALYFLPTARSNR